MIRQLETFARQRLLTAARMPVLFLQLEQNTAWWSKNAPPPPAEARLEARARAAPGRAARG